jgi:hypothetical protein
MYGIDVAKPGGQDYYDSIAKLYAEWGLDFIKADDMFGSGEGGDHSSEIAALSTALRKTGRSIVLSLSPGTRDSNKAAFIGKYAQMWRISSELHEVEPLCQGRQLAGWRHASPRPHRYPCGTRRPAHVAADPR